MRKTIALIVCVILSVSFMIGCDESVEKSPEKAPEIVITVDEVGEGMAVEEIPVYVTFDGEPVECRTEWVVYFEDGYDYMEGKDLIPPYYYGRVDVYYDLPKGVASDDLPINVEAANGTYDGTGDLGENSEGQIQVWSHIEFDFRIDTEVLITVGELKPGLSIDSIPVSVQINGEDVDCRAEWIVYFEDGYDYLKGSDVIPEKYCGRVDVYYTLPKDVPSDYPNVVIDAPGGLYDGTGDVGVDFEGRVEAWSHIQYDFSGQESAKETEEVVKQTESKVPETQKPAPETQKPVPETQKPVPETQKPVPETQKPVPETKPHVHSWSVNKNQSLSASCETAGWKQFYCTGCSETYREEVAAYGHNWGSRVTKGATCTETGVKQYICNNCGSSYDESIPATGHAMSSSTTNAPSCTGQGSGVNRCSICGYEETYSIGATGHSWGAAYYSSGRYHARTCSGCGATEEESHYFASGSDVRCLGCGADIVN